jgi:hypothetical protein
MIRDDNNIVVAIPEYLSITMMRINKAFCEINNWLQDEQEEQEEQDINHIVILLKFKSKLNQS